MHDAVIEVLTKTIVQTVEYKSSPFQSLQHQDASRILG
jgi:hypothetical protein